MVETRPKNAAVKTGTSTLSSFATRKNNSQTSMSDVAQFYRMSLSRASRSFVDRCHCFAQRSKSMGASVAHPYNLDEKGEEKTKINEKKTIVRPSHSPIIQTNK